MGVTCTAADMHLRSSQAMGILARNPFTVTSWLNAVWNPGARKSFVGIYGPATDTPLATPVTGLQIGTTNGAGELSFWTYGGTIMCGTAANFMTPYNNQWVFCAYTYDGTTHRGFLNGIQVCTGTPVQTAGYLNQMFINGYPGGGNGETAAFKIDQYTFYDRCLTTDEILTMYNASGARHGITQNLVCRYEYDELGEGIACSSVPDLSGRGNTLTTIGAGTAFTYTYINAVANSNIRPVQ